MTSENYLITEFDQYDFIINRMDPYISNKCVIFFTGELGSGKTSFIKKFLSYKYSFSGVTSPTFGIINSYSISNTYIYHYDLYRIKNDLELGEIGFYNNLDINTLHLIEWPEIIPKKIVKPNILINFETNIEERLISINYTNE